LPSISFTRSLFQLLIGEALIRREDLVCPTWGVGNSANADIRMVESEVEQRVSQIIGKMRFLWLAIDDEPGPANLRAYVERNSIALLSNYDAANWYYKSALQPHSNERRGHDRIAHRARIPGSLSRIDDRTEDCGSFS
jgi:hypothetical protein